MKRPNNKPRAMDPRNMKKIASFDPDSLSGMPRVAQVTPRPAQRIMFISIIPYMPPAGKSGFPRSPERRHRFFTLREAFRPRHFPGHTWGAIRIRMDRSGETGTAVPDPPDRPLPERIGGRRQVVENIC